MPQKDRKIGKYSLVLTCLKYPEQYDVFLEKEKVGYLRLRHGNFSIDIPYCGGDTIFCARVKGDGEFNEDERLDYLTAAVDIIEIYRRFNR